MQMEPTPVPRKLFDQKIDIFLAARDGNVRLLSRIAQFEYVDQLNGIKQTPLIVAIVNNRQSVITRLLELKANSNVSDHLGQTPLMHAAKVRNHRAVQELLYSGADPNLKDHNGMTALHFATAQRDIGSVEMLIDCRNIDVDLLDKTESSALAMAAQCGANDIVMALVDKGASTATTNTDGKTPYISQP